MSTSIIPRYPRGAKLRSDIEFYADGEPVNKWVRGDGAGWYEPPPEVIPMLDLLKPQLLWAPIQQEFQIKLVDAVAGLQIYIKPYAPAESWKRAMCALAEWKKL